VNAKSRCVDLSRFTECPNHFCLLYSINRTDSLALLAVNYAGDDVSTVKNLHSVFMQLQ